MKEIVTMSTDVNQQPRAGIHAERFDDELVLRFPSLSRLMRAVLPNEAVNHIQAARREQLLALRARAGRCDCAYRSGRAW